MTDYVLVHPRTDFSKVLLILKNKPAFLAGRLNLVGGKIEPQETPLAAADRELMEEAGLVSVTTPVLCGRIVENDNVVYCFAADVIDETLNPGINETEPVGWHDWKIIQKDSRLIPNLKLIIPLLQSQVTGWTIRYPESNDTIKVSFQNETVNKNRTRKTREPI